MSVYKIVVFGGDHCGPEVSQLTSSYEKLLIPRLQVTAEAIKVWGRSTLYQNFEVLTVPLDSQSR